MSIKISDIIPSPKPIISKLNDSGSKPTIIQDTKKSTEPAEKSTPDTKKSTEPAEKLNPDTKKSTEPAEKSTPDTKKSTEPAEILLSNRNQILSGGTYIQAWRDFHNALKPILEKMETMYGVKNDNHKSDAVSFRTFIEKNAPNIKKFDESLSLLTDVVKKGTFSFDDILNINKLFDNLDNIGKKADDSDETTKFHKQLKDLNAQWDKLFNTTDNRTKFVYHMLQSIDTIIKLDNAIKKLSQSPLNQNADLALFSERIDSAARNIREVGGNITAYSQSNHFDEHGFYKRALELPQCFKEFTKTLSEIAENPLVQNNKEYIELLTNVYTHAMHVMEKFIPEIKKGIDNKYKDIQDVPQGKYDYTHLTNNTNASHNPTPQPMMKEEHIAKPNKGNNTASSQMNINKTHNTDALHKPKPQPMMSEEHIIKPHQMDNLTPSQMNVNQMIEFLKQKSNNPQNLIAPYSARESVHLPTSDDKELRALQGLWDWADHSAHMKNKINAVNEIGQTMEEMAMAGSGKPNPEMVALAKRAGRLSSLNSLIKEVPKINKSIQELERAALEAEHANMTGVNQIATQRLRMDIDAAHMQSEQQKIANKGIEKLSLDALEISTNATKNFAKITGLFNEILMSRIENVWDGIKRLMRGGFKF